MVPNARRSVTRNIFERGRTAHARALKKSARVAEVRTGWHKSERWNAERRASRSQEARPPQPGGRRESRCAFRRSVPLHFHSGKTRRAASPRHEKKARRAERWLLHAHSGQSRITSSRLFSSSG